ncbi:strictosidine synthase [Actinoplanes sp. OR16]|uniref:SMP-30/gluconolactonase/LRE family protein n=1 Tax=Actinoplanes sp. OR16 TaxID=946334 RepID=UPI000F6D28B6|nr:SMP-30/gluconolactonase/LRE family protein [Actinoplanes sp. OR16]BBH69776.1 strictosidine synthase [Actinoplanes sp. OR16]
MARRLISPQRWTPPTFADAGPTGPLRVKETLATGGHGPEDVRFTQDGAIITGLQDGSIVRVEPSTGTRTVIGSTGGRPLGVWPVDDGVLVCDHDRGLLLLRDGEVEVLAGGFTFASNVVRGAGGTIWFTTSTSEWTVEEHLGDILEHSCTGRLMRRDPDGAVTTLIPDLKFGNGIVLAPDESYLLVAETAGYRIRRYWLTGPDAGRSEMFAENLAGFPDNMSLGTDGLLWVAIAAPRNHLVDRLLPLPGFLRVLVWNLPDFVRPKAVPIAWVMAFGLDGTLVYDLRGSDGSYGFVTSVAERDGTVVLGSLTESTLAVLARD